MAATEAVTEATRLPDIKFPEFTAKLITDVFDALVAANIKQTESYIELISAVAKGVSEYINETKDDISGEEILQFLAKVVPPADDDEDKTGTKVAEEGTLTEGEADNLKAALKKTPDEIIPAETVPEAVGGTVTLNKDAYNAILNAAAERIASNKYYLLEKMVQQGILRLVVENGVIETRLTFSTHGSSFYQEKSNRFNRSTYNHRKRSATSGIVALFGRTASATNRTSLTISTAEKINQDRTGSNVNIFGRVQINFKTDYLPLNQ